MTILKIFCSQGRFTKQSKHNLSLLNEVSLRSERKTIY